MEEQRHDSDLQLTTLAFGGSSTGSCYSLVFPSHQFPVTAQNNGDSLVPTTPLPHWIYCQQTPQNYVEFMSEPGASEVGKEISNFSHSVSSGLTPIEASTKTDGLKVDCLQPPNEVAPSNNLTSSEHLISSENSNQGYSNAARVLPPKIPRSKRRHISNVDRCHRAKIAERLQAMKELLPHSAEHSNESIVDDIINLIKYLKTQIKDLSQSKLGGEPSCTPLIFHEAYGHYLLHDELLNKPLEEMIGKLLEENPLAATELLESRGLFMMPAALVERLPQNI